MPIFKRKRLISQDLSTLDAEARQAEEIRRKLLASDEVLSSENIRPRLPTSEMDDVLELNQDELQATLEETTPTDPEAALDAYIQESDAVGFEKLANEIEHDIVHEDVTEEIEDISHEDQFDVKPRLTEAEIPGMDALNLSEMRLDVVRISSDIESGESLYRRAQQRIENLVSFIERAEVTMSRLSHVDSENRELKAKAHRVEMEIQESRDSVTRLEAESEKQRLELRDKSARIEKLRAKIIKAEQIIRERKGDIERLSTKQEETKIQNDRIKTNLDVEMKENISLRQKLSELSDRIEVVTESRIEAEKTSETRKFEIESLTTNNTQLKLTVKEINNKLAAEERETRKLRDQFTVVQDRIVSFKDAKRRELEGRDAKLVTMDAQLEDLNRKLAMKEEIVQSAVIDVSELRKVRTAQELEQEKLHKLAESQHYQIGKLQEEVASARQAYMDLDQKYRNLAKLLSEERDQRKRLSIETEARLAEARLAETRAAEARAAESRMEEARKWADAKRTETDSMSLNTTETGQMQSFSSPPPYMPAPSPARLSLTEKLETPPEDPAKRLKTADEIAYEEAKASASEFDDIASLIANELNLD